jgi:hypothetical protein
MTDVTPKVGDKIRVSSVGTVEKVARPRPGLIRLSVKRPSGRTAFLTIGPESDATIEILEAALVDGGIYADADGEVFRFSSAADDDRGGWYEFDRHNQEWETNPHALHYATRPVLRLDS